MSILGFLDTSPKLHSAYCRDKSDDQQHLLHYSMTLEVYGAKIYVFIVQRFSACLFLKQIFMFQHCYNSHHELFDSYRSNDKFTAQ